MKYFVMKAADKFSQEEWTSVVDLYDQIMQKTCPYQLFENKSVSLPNPEKPEGPTDIQQLEFVKFNHDVCVTQCVIQLSMITIIKETTEANFNHLIDEVSDLA
jgi:hypothetical protein